MRLDLDRTQADGQAYAPADPPRDPAADDAPQGDPATDSKAPAIELAPTAEPTPPLDQDDLLSGDEPVTQPTDDPEVVQPTDDPSDGFDGAVGMRVQDRTSTDGLLSTIVGGVTGYFFGG